MFGCCCVNKKALKKEQQKGVAGETKAENGSGETKLPNVIKSPSATDAASLKSPTKQDKSISSDEENNLSGLIISDGLVGNVNAKLSQGRCGPTQGSQN